MTSVQGCRFVNLDEEPKSPLVQSFIELYNRTFTDPTEWEDPVLWLHHLGTPEPSPYPLLFATVVPNPGTTEVAAGLVYEYYRESGCALMTYLAVDEHHRRQGLAKALILHALARVKNIAKGYPKGLLAVFSEMEDPAMMEGRPTAIDPEERRSVMRTFGLRRVPIPYVQPELTGGEGRSRHLMLATRPLREGQTTLDGAIVCDFINEFYRALGIQHPESDPDYIAIAQATGSELELVDL
jgi:GNAT superfamily N-acetyltransferase